MFFVCIALWGLIACGSSSKNDFPNLSPDEFERLIQDEIVQRVDVRTVEPVAVYCKSGRRSRNAARLLSQKGFKVYNLDKGFESWKENGKEIEK